MSFFDENEEGSASMPPKVEDDNPIAVLLRHVQVRLAAKSAAMLLAEVQQAHFQTLLARPEFSNEQAFALTNDTTRALLHTVEVVVPALINAAPAIAEAFMKFDPSKGKQ